jgi:hypothetical protein
MFGTYIATLDDGSTREVSIDNRDFIAFRRRGYRDLGMASPDPVSKLMTDLGESGNAAEALNMIEVVAWLLWNAGTRSGAWAVDFDVFVEKECVSYSLKEGTEPVGPTAPASVATSPS